MSSKKGKRSLANKHFPIAESVSIALKIQLDKFIRDENETELKFPTFLSAQERAFIHNAVAKLGLKSKSRGKGDNRFLTVYKRIGSTIIQNDAKLILDSNMRCSIGELFNAFPITSKEKEDLSCCPEKERSPQLAHKTLGQLNNGTPLIPNTTYNPELQKFREKLPVYEQRQDLLNAIIHNQVVIVAGATGCGKTTQLPQLVLEACQAARRPARVICTQPRRISAVSVAERVAYERMEKIGQSIGYQIRLESRVSPRTVLTYCTNGVLLRTLMSGENALAGVTHIFVDEVHERDKLCDFLLIAVRDALLRYKDLKIILMSATMDTLIFSKYFNNCPVLTIPGRLHEVQRYYLEDVLKITQYTNNKMKQVEKELRAKKKDGQSYWSQLEKQKQSEENGGTASNDVKDSTESKDSSSNDSAGLDPAMQADMDHFLAECFDDGSLDSFCQLLYMYMSEGVPAQSTDSRGRSGLMAAASHGLSETVEHILTLGADPQQKDNNGKTAYDYAKENGHEECAKLLVTPNPREDSADQDQTSAEDDFLLDVYYHTISEDSIDHDLILALVKHIHLNLPKGSILIFLPGYEDIATLRELVESSSEMSAIKYQVFTLHSNMQTLDQKKVFNPLPAARKIIIATNIAETSITIDDVVYVVDSCKVKEKYYESGGVSSLQCVWAARAALRQRAGRAGRVRAGHAFHLASRRRVAALPAHAPPEMVRAPLQELCLQSKLLAGGGTAPIADFLCRAPDPPPFLAVRNAVALLKTVGALTATEDLTEVGRHLLDLTVEPKLGKMLLYACVCKCLDPVLTVVCSLAHRAPFVIAAEPERRRRGGLARRELAADTLSDHMCLLRAFQAWQAARAQGPAAERAFCARHLVCGATMETIVGSRAQLLAQLRALSLVKARGSGDIKDVNLNSEKWHVVKAVLVAGLYPSVARVDRDTGTLRTSKEVRVAFHPSSTLHVGGSGRSGVQRALQSLPADWLVFEEMSRTGRFCFVRCNTVVTPLTVALFGGPLRLPAAALTQRANPPPLSSDSDSEPEHSPAPPDSATLALDDWIAFTADASDAISVYYLRQKLCALVLRRMSNPAKPMTPLDEQILSTVVHVLGAEERNVGLNQPAGVGQRPKPLTVDSPSWRRLDADDQYQPRHAQYPHDYQHQGYYGHYGYRNGQNRPGTSWRTDGNGPGQFSPQSFSGPKSPMSPNGKTLLANIEKYSEQDNTRYFVTKVEDLHALETAQNGGTYQFPPNTAKKLQKVKQEGSRVVVLFLHGASSKLLGSASLTDTGLEWLSTRPLPFHMFRNVMNPLAGNSRVTSSRDGQEVCPSAARVLLATDPRDSRDTRDSRDPRDTRDTRDSARRRAPRPIQKHTHHQ